ncbi:MAG: hypothetical protein ABSA27_16665 [Terriglobales bacterium]
MTGWSLPGATWPFTTRPFSTWRCARRFLRAALSAFLAFVLLGAAAQGGWAQTSPQGGPYERIYQQSKSAVEKALKELQPSMRGRLPALEGFALPGNHPLNQYQRAYYQSAVQVSSTASGGAVVRVNTKVTAWYTDSTPSHSGYQLLTSNGRLESDLLDQLSDLLASSSGGTTSGGSSNVPTIAPPATAKRPAIAEKGVADPGIAEPTISAPMPQLPGSGHTFSSSIEPGLSGQQLAETKNSQNRAADQAAARLEAEAASLEEVLKNQAHPKNLVAIKKTGTPVVASPSLNAKPLFLATAHDEFEMLDFNADWVHVRISGLSRGWIWRTSLEMPEGFSDVPLVGTKTAPVAADLFLVKREETAPFPGDWEPLRGKNVKIVSVQKVQEDEKNSGATAKLEFAKSLLDKNYAELAAKSQELAGVVLIFDSVDGGMIAITLPTVQQWKAGKLTDAALWHRCYFDPPETFNVSSPAGVH